MYDTVGHPTGKTVALVRKLRYTRRRKRPDRFRRLRCPRFFEETLDPK